VRELRGADVQAEVITFGSPCQDLSVAGKRAGFDGARSGLFFEAIRIISEMREANGGQFPVAAIWENVPGAKSSADGRDFGAALDALAGCGAVDIGWRIINAEHWVPQRRRRVFVVALFSPFATGRAGDGRSAAILSLAHSVRRNPAKGREAGQDLAGTLGGGSGNRGWSSDTERMTFVPETSPAVTSKWAKGSGGPAGDEVQNTVAYAVRTAQTSANGHGVAEDVAHTLDGAQGQAVALNIYSGGQRKDRPDGGFYVEQDPNTAKTLDTAGLNPSSNQGGTAVMTRWAVRRLTPTECLVLQGFPRTWFDGLGLADSAKYRLCGNAVAVPVIRWLGEQIMKVQP
jgi:DNA (cytosine-5)-methyltransferase 1